MDHADASSAPGRSPWTSRVASRSRRSKSRTASTVNSAAAPSQSTRFRSSGRRSYWNVAMSLQRSTPHRSQFHTQFMWPRACAQPDSTMTPSPNV